MPNEANLMQAIINAMPTPIFYKDAEGRYLGCNKAFEEYTGLRRDQLVGEDVFKLFDDELAKVYYEADRALFESQGTQCYEAKVSYADGSIHDVMFHKAYFYAEDEQIDGVVGAILDITERKKAEEALEKLALSDSLTGLDNRYALLQNLKYSLKRQQRDNFTLAFLMLDLDDFKQVNDSYGHPAGDALLIGVAERLKKCFRDSDVICRHGGDEFSIILEKISSIECLKILANKVLSTLSEPFEIDNNMIMIGVSIGIAVSPPNGGSPKNLIKQADVALYQAKEKGKGCYQLAM